MSIAFITILLFAVFGILLLAGVPISISILISSIVTALSSLSWDQVTFITMQKMCAGVESFSLLAVPLFILAGNIMNNGGIARRLVHFAQLFVGKIPGSMAQANILGNMLFGALSGSSVAAASAMGGCIAPIEKENGYDPAYSAAANIASAPTGLLIPPTSAFIVYSTVAGGVSISTLFMAGYIPGILMGACCMAIAFILAKKAGMKADSAAHTACPTNCLGSSSFSCIDRYCDWRNCWWRIYRHGRSWRSGFILSDLVFNLQDNHMEKLHRNFKPLCENIRYHFVSYFRI